MAEIILDSVLGVSATNIVRRHQNLWVGISNTPWFQTPDNLEQLVGWAMEHTRDDLLVCVPGRMYAVNTNHIEKKSRAKALREGFAAEDRFRRRIETFCGSLTTKAHLIHLVGYDDILTPTFVRRRGILYRAFSEEENFYARVMEVAHDVLHSRGRTISKDRAEAVALYQLQELPMFVAPLQPIEKETKYDTVVYPGLGKFDQLARDLAEGVAFPDLTKQLQLTEPCGIANVSFKESS